jgi:hypothetical protein
MQAIFYGAFLIFLLGCGSSQQNPPTTNINAPDSSCKMVDHCTYDPTTKTQEYDCEALRWTPSIASGATIPSSDYEGYPCIITREDHQISQTDPSCDPSNPTQFCSSWDSTPYPCCQQQDTQGPGLPALPSDPISLTPSWAIFTQN